MKAHQTLGELADVTVGHVGPMVSEYTNEGVPFLRSQNVVAHRIDPEGLLHITPDFHSVLRKSTLKPGDVVIVRTGKPGTAAVIPEWLGEANCSDLVIVRPGPNIDSRWLSYYINAAAQTFVGAHLVGAVQQHFNVGSAKRVTIPRVELDDQRAIAEVLGALDDKIAANAQVIERLDQLATALVLRGTGSTTTRVQEIATVSMGSSPRGESLNESGEGMVFHQGIRDFGLRTPQARIFTTAPLRKAECGDILLSVRAPVGTLNRAAGEICVGRGIAALRSKTGTPHCLFHALRGAREAWASFNGEGTVFGSINRDSLLVVSIPWADSQDDLIRLEAELSPFEDRIDLCVHESNSLADLRDTLLPHLMSGRLTVRQAEALVAVAL